MSLWVRVLVSPPGSRSAFAYGPLVTTFGDVVRALVAPPGDGPLELRDFCRGDVVVFDPQARANGRPS